MSRYHLSCSKGYFYYRLKIPVDLKHFFPSPIIKRSLKTTDIKAARCMAVGLEYKVQQTFEALVDTGMRLSELLDLRYEDVNFTSNLISIWVNKGDRPRSIPMTGRVRTILEERHINNSKPFIITVDETERAWQWVRAKIGLEGDSEFVIHALRHTCASRLVNAGVDLYVVKEWLGHSTIQITEKYAHLNPVKLVHAVEALE